MDEQRYVAHGVIETGGRFLLIQRGSGRYLGDWWDVPGGTVESGETPGEAAVRECQEEVGIDCRLGEELSRFMNLDTGGRDILFHTVTYRLQPVSTLVVVRLSREHQDYRWVTWDEAAEFPVVWHVAKTLTGLWNVSYK
ncbi:MAG: NUDIX hydrolase [Propionibacteriaceae bacterium]|jgi:8-oxo-dGTP diphosphatase|nr:NUDIX hydrolase [Propionibacteriaceae bacterium]